MLSALEYRKQSRKVVTLSNGYEVLIRKIPASDCALKVGQIPMAFWDGDEDEFREEGKKDPTFALLFRRTVIISGVMEPRIVDKDMKDCTDDELSIQEIPDWLQDEMLWEIMTFSKASKGAAKEIARFPEQSGTASNG